MDTQKCGSCTLYKPWAEFYKDKSKANGYGSVCKVCRKIQNKARYEAKKEEIKSANKQYFHNNKDKCQQRHKKYKAKHKSELQAKRRKWHDNKIETDICYRLRHALRDRMRKALKHKIKKGSSVRDLGCTGEELKTYLESKFQPGMSWENYGIKGWHIDHIKPLSSFNLENREEFLQACHYTNLQPLWAIDNMKKSDKYELKAS